MDRRTLVISLACLLAAPPRIRAQAPGKVWRFGYLSPAFPADSAALESALTAALRELGYVEGRNLQFETRAAAEDFPRLPALAAELVKSNVDIIVAVSPPAILAAREATKTIPIVMSFWGGPGLVESGTITAFARPGTNVTGVYMLAAELEQKRLELLTQAVPSARRVAVLSPGSDDALRLDELRGIAQAAKVELRLSPTPPPHAYLRVFEAMAGDRIDAVLVPSFPRFYLERLEIIAAAAHHRLPAMYEWGDMARAGGLIAYGPDFVELHRRVARYVDHILKGAKPSELPVEQPTKFELVINLRTAKALGVTIPQSVILRADEVVQ